MIEQTERDRLEDAMYSAWGVVVEGFHIYNRDEQLTDAHVSLLREIAVDMASQLRIFEDGPAILHIDEEFRESLRHVEEHCCRLLHAIDNPEASNGSAKATALHRRKNRRRAVSYH